MPTGVHLRDARQQLFDAAERVLLRGGAGALSSRAVTDEAGCAKGVLHRHFADFDAFLTELVLDRSDALSVREAELLRRAGTGSMTDTLADALGVLLGPVPLAIIPLITFRDELRARLRVARPGGGMAILAQATDTVRRYLAAERDLGRIAAGADVEALTLSLVGGAHLLFADDDGGAPTPAAVQSFVAGVLAGAGRPRAARSSTGAGTTGPGV